MGTYRIFKGKSVFLKLFGSYLLILGLTLAVEMGISVQILTASRKQVETLNKSLIQLVRNECDNQIRTIYRSLDVLALDEKVQSLSNVKGEFRPNNQYKAFALYEELQNMRFSSDGYELLYVFFRNTDSVVSASGNMSLEMYHSLYYKNLDITLEELRDYLSGQHYHDIKIVSAAERTGAIMFTMTSLNTEAGGTDATIVIQITPDMVNDRIESVKWNEDVRAAILNSENEFVNSVVFPEAGGLTYESAPIDTNFSICLNEEDYIGIAMKSTEADWIYVLMAQEDIIEDSANQVKKYCLAGLGVCLALGFLFSYYLTTQNYNPIKGLMELFRKRQKDQEDNTGLLRENEYQWLENQARRFFTEHEDIQRNLSRDQKRLKDFCLYKLLTQPYEELDAVELEVLNQSGVTDGILRVVFLSVGAVREERREEMADAAEDMTQELKLFIIKNVAGEMLNEVFPSEMLDTGKAVIALIRLDAMNTDNYDLMWNALSRAFDLIKEKFQFCMQICAGTAKEGVGGVHLSYLEAKETEEYAALLDTYYINYNDIRNRSKRYYYPLEADSRIINAIIAGKPDIVIRCVNEILHTNYHENHIAVKLLTWLIYDLLGTVMRGADEIGCSDFFEQYWKDFEGFEDLSRKSLEKIEEQFAELIYALCGEAEKRKSGGDTNLADKIQKYIRENYRDPDLNISQTALHFEKTPAYISSVYKKQTGKSLLKLITQMRIDCAVELLQEGKSVNDTAVLSGFRDSRSFIRVFKESTGLTPGQMKKE